MLSESIHGALRARLTADFEALSQGVTDAGKVTKILQELIHTTTGILCDLASTWSVSHTTAHCLPPEMLSSCFMMLDEFTDRITVSHVSRAWRSAALTHPAIWADLDFTVYEFRDEPALMQMALSRTGQYPAKLYVPEYDTSDLTVSCLTQHINHIGDLTLRSPDQHGAALCLPAPMLEAFSAMCNSWEVPGDFLGAHVGKLTLLNLPAVCFPPTCPALSTVTNLTLSFPRDPEDASTYVHLFELFPALNSLSLSLLRLALSDSLPRGPAPPTLGRLNLHTLDLHYDLITHYVDWQYENNLDDVSLVMDAFTAPECNLQAFVTDVVELTIRMTGGPQEANIFIEAGCTGQRIRSLELDMADYDGAEVAELIAHVPAALTGVWAFELPANTLDAFIERDVFTVLPKLTQLTVTIQGSPEHEFQWDSLASLPRELHACPLLKRIIISVACYWKKDETPLSAGDARALVAVLEQIESGLPGVRITGFTEDAVRDVRIHQDLDIHFDSSPLGLQ